MVCVVYAFIVVRDGGMLFRGLRMGRECFVLNGVSPSAVPEVVEKPGNCTHMLYKQAVDDINSGSSLDLGVWT